MSDRVREYCTTQLGANSPHAGGWPLKTLANLDELLHVHYGYCAHYTTAETRLLDHFSAQLSEDTREALYDSTFVMPFANLEDGHGHRKRHDIKGARAPKNTANTHRVEPEPATPPTRLVAPKPSTLPNAAAAPESSPDGSA